MEPQEREAERMAELQAVNAQLQRELAERKRAEREIERRLQEVTLLYQISNLIAASADSTNALQGVCAELAHFLQVPQSGFAILNPERTAAEVIADHHPPGSPGAIGAAIPVVGNPSMAYILEHKSPLVVGEAQADPLLSPVHAIMRQRHVQTILIVPVIADGEVIGTLGFDAFEPRSFTAADIDLVQSIANQAGQILMRKRAEEALQRRAREREALRQAAAVINSSLEVNAILRLILDQMRRVLVYSTASVAVLREGDVPDLVVAVGYEDEQYTIREAGRLLKQSPILHRMAQDLLPVVSPDVRQLEGWIWVPGSEHVRSWMGIPIVAHERMIGALMVDHSLPGLYGEAELQLAQVLAQHAAQALENARSYEERVRLERQARERQLYLEAVLASAPDAIVTLDARHRVVEWNPGAEQLFGYSREEVIGHDIDDLITDPATFKEAAGFTQLLLSGKHMLPAETVRYRRDGSPVDVLVAGSPILIDDELIGLVGIYKDIGQRKRTERALRRANRGLQMLSECSVALSRARDEAGLLGEICQIAVDSGGYRMAWVGLAQHDDAKGVRAVAQAGFEDRFLEAIDITWADSESGRDPTGTAIRTGRPSTSRNIAAEPYSARWREEATRRGYASCVGLPLMANGHAFGALSIYAAEPDAFGPDEVGLLAELADNLAYGIEALHTRADRTRAEDALRRYAERLETMHQIDRAILEAQSAEAIAQATLVRITQLVPCQQAYITTFGVEASQPAVLAAYSCDPAPQGRKRGHLPEPVRSEVNFPLMAQGELIGTLDLRSCHADAFAPEHIEIGYEVAAPLAVAIQHARLNEQLRHYADGLEATVAQRTRELKVERDRSQAILESLGEAVIVTDIDGTILYVNPATAALTGYGSDEVSGQNWRLLHGAVGSIEAYAQAQEAIRAGKAWRGEMTNRRKDSSRYDMAVTAAPLFAPDDVRRTIGSVWVQRDITLVKEAERIKDQFVSNVSHELRTPLSIITLVSGNLDKLYDRLNDRRRQDMIRSIREQVGLLNDLVGDVLEISRIDSRHISTEHRKLDLVRLVHEEVDKQLPLARKKSQTLHIVGQESLTVRGNDGQLRQVIRNLLNNGIKFTPDGGQITCECLVQEGGGDLDMEWPGGAGLPPGRWAGLRVIDTGIGISREDLHRLFERFYRVKTEGNIPGTGLGLAITRELVELHGGYVAVGSSPGQGSVFAVYLPLSAEP